MQAVAKLSKCPSSPRKMRLVVDQIRGKGVDEALNMLKYIRRETSGKIEKLVLSAISNWEQKNDLRPEDYDLFIKEAFVDGGTMLKRLRPAPHGRAHRIRKRSNHVTIVVDSKVPVDMGNKTEAVEAEDQIEETEE
ncbi:MAG: 50S ribosomal protein L22 [Chitinophagales bacterium]|nr:50S ribosomal protein L22 [Chitinophagales bacterium]